MKYLKTFEEVTEKIIFEMTGSPRKDLEMFPPKKRTKATFAQALSEHGYVHGPLNQKCDILVAEDMDIWTNKMRKAEEMGVEVTTYAKLIKKYGLFKGMKKFESVEKHIKKFNEKYSTTENMMEFLWNKMTKMESELESEIGTDDFEDDFSDNFYDIFDDVKNWPEIKGEKLDMENFSWLSLDDQELVICCGGDWQEPLTITMEVQNGELVVTNAEDGFSEGMEHEEVIKDVENWYKKEYPDRWEARKFNF